MESNNKFEKAAYKKIISSALEFIRKAEDQFPYSRDNLPTEKFFGVWDLELGVMIIAGIIAAATVEMVGIMLYYSHTFVTLFVVPLALYLFLFIVHKTVRGKDDHDNRSLLFFFMCLTTVAMFGYGFICVN